VQSHLKSLGKNHQVLAVKLKNFGGFLKRNSSPASAWEPNLRQGKVLGRVGGIFHTDELPAYGVTIEEAEDVKRAAGASENDAVVFVADSSENVIDALRAVVERAKEALTSVHPKHVLPTLMEQHGTCDPDPVPRKCILRLIFQHTFD